MQYLAISQHSGLFQILFFHAERVETTLVLMFHAARVGTRGTMRKPIFSEVNAIRQTHVTGRIMGTDKLEN